MKWATFRPTVDQGADRVGVLLDKTIFAMPAGVRLVDLIGNGNAGLQEAAQQAMSHPADTFALSDVQFRPPIPNPPSIRDFSSFHEHISVSMKNMGAPLKDEWFEAPVFYFTSPNNLFGDGELVRVPGDTARMDYELEVCAIIGLGGMDIAPSDAAQHIAGYTILNDWSARDLQEAEMRRLPIGPGKGKDASTSIGPFLVTADELQDRASRNGFDLAMTATVNGVVYSKGNWDSIYWSFAEMVAFASRSSPLVPGDIIGAGTVGTGCILELSGSYGSDRYPWLREGDEIVLEVERLGTLRNKVAWNKKPPPLR